MVDIMLSGDDLLTYAIGLIVFVIVTLGPILILGAD